MSNPSTAPELPGLTYLRDLGAGGFAQVFLYEQHLTGQQVAVKVLDDDGLDDEIRQKFITEARTMASLARHRFIVSVFTADITDEGRPYLVMQYYERANLAVRCRSKPFAVREVLQIGVQIASAVETAHRAGILHRDIKPANILTDSYGDPGLTDFGIAAQAGDGHGAAEGMSLPWSPPEVVDWLDSDERADVYSLGATLWHLLAGHSPFEVKGGPNTRTALTDRIKTQPVPDVPREDVPASLQALLRQVMAKDPQARPRSALALAHRLRGIQQELRLPLTEILVQEDEPEYEAAADAGEATSVRAPVVIHPDVPTPSPRQTGNPAHAAQRAAAWQPVVEESDETADAGTGDHDSGDHKTTARVSPDLSRTEQRAGQPPAAAPASPGHRRRQLPTTAALDSTTVRPREAAEPSAAAAGSDLPARPAGPARAGGGSRRAVLLGAVAALAAVAIVGGVVASRLGGKDGAQAPPVAQARVDDQSALSGQNQAVAPGVPTVTGARSGTAVTFSWTYDDAQTGDTFRYQRVDGSDGSPTPVTTPRVTITAPAGQQVCIQVRAVRATGLASPASSVRCA